MDAIVVYGLDDACAASRAMVAELSRRGFTDVAWYAGGLAEWQSAGTPVEGMLRSHRAN